MYAGGRSRVVRSTTPRCFWPRRLKRVSGAVIVERPVYTWNTISDWEPDHGGWSTGVEHLAEVVATDDALGAEDVFSTRSRRGGSVHVETQSVSIRA
jgi:hypothetical protein